MKRDFRIDARGLELEDAMSAWAVIEPIWMLPAGSDHDARLPAPWRDVTAGQLRVYAVTWVEREVINGGFWQYLYNTSADLPLQALEGFQTMGSTDYAGLLKRALSVFPGGVLPPTRGNRMRCLPEDPYEEEPEQQRALLNTLDELNSKFYELYGDGAGFYGQIANYVRGHPEEFFVGL
ncbi:MAG: hypothetical protein AMXMBFR83_27780 [Phycisphaerae bacterium]